MELTLGSRILVIGGTGLLGEPVARHLQADGYVVRIMTRRPDRAREMFHGPFEIVQGDVRDEYTLNRAIHGCQGVHINLRGGPSAKEFEEVEHQGIARVAKVCAEQEVQRLTYLSSIYVAPEHLDVPSIRAKFMAEQEIVASGVPYTILRTTWMMESLARFLNKKWAIMPGKQPQPVRWLAGDDFGRLVSLVFRSDEVIGKTLFVVGPEAYAKPEALKIYREIVHPKKQYVRLPLWMAQAASLVAGDANFRAHIQEMSFFEELGDQYGNPEETQELFGRATTTLQTWCDSQKGFA
ncbi:NAD(P)H-binding protein [Pontibacter sp. G13]|uniref:SDR family oxidoreductase n=1 Tax=Pontibacter sp. G13 TaxID=3074898 RepID=UPI00288B56F0|nr:NAD(P)H-binding protein [Pontibacter sp. G13]WNJ19985.1 NAD(P)H-binding protein [Pontibacter sp. G13]